MKKKGFTLVELMGVLIIIGILLVVVGTPIIGQIRNQKEKLTEATAKILFSSIDSYLEDNKNLYPKKDGMIYYISVGQLLNKQYLRENFLEKTQSVLTSESIVEIKVKNGNYSYSLDSTYDKSLLSVYNQLSNDNMYSYLGGNYLKGNIMNNYVYYSGFLWRIMGKNYDGSIRLITDDPVTSLGLSGIDTNSYDDGYVNEWLNSYFISRLAYNDIIVKFPWCIASTISSSDTSDACNSMNKDEMLNAKVGLLSLQEYNLSISTSTTYIKSNIKFATLTNYTNQGNNFYEIYNSNKESVSSIYSYVKPVINVESSIVITGGSGLEDDPYILNKNIDIDYHIEKKLNDLNVTAGEYIKLDTNIYRIIEHDNTKIKVIKESLGTANVYGTDNIYSSEGGIGYYLNNSYYQTNYGSYEPSMFVVAPWYQGDYGLNSYKFTTLAKTNFIHAVKIGLPKVGELLTIPILDTSYWTMSKADATSLYVINNDSINAALNTDSKAFREVIVFNANISVSEGNGTKLSPYVIG